MSTETNNAGRILVETVINKLKNKTFSFNIEDEDLTLYITAIKEAPRVCPINAFYIQLYHTDATRSFYLNGDWGSIYFDNSPSNYDICDYEDVIDHLPIELTDKILIYFVHVKNPIKFFHEKDSEHFAGCYLLPFAGRINDKAN